MKLLCLGLFTSVYDNAQDYQYVIQNSTDPSLVFSTSIARIMKAFMFSKLVDQFNDVPYFDALKGQANLTPKYDDAVKIYEDLVKECNESMAAIATGLAANVTTPGSIPFPNAKADPVFAATDQTANMVNWRRFANSLKLRLLVKLATSGKSAAFANAQFAAYDTTLGIITDDVTVNPGFGKVAGQQAPIYNSMGYSVAGVRAYAQRIPTRWIATFFNGVKIQDPARAAVLFRSIADANTNQLGNESTVTTQVPPTTPISSSSFYTGTTVGGDALGAVKGAGQSAVVMLWSEAQFLLAEAYERGYLAGGTAAATTAFNNGVTNHFRYLYKTAAARNATTGAETVDASKNPTTDANTYRTTNAAVRLVNYSLNTTLDQRIEAIMTQKYIALSIIASDEAFNEFRRTGYPAIVNGSAVATETFASRASASTRPDRLPSRILYPTSEYATNSANAPAGINQFTSRIFWDLN
ncbi:MAG: SusD/RagB family nutrient-binding outer membrane lipoprotein [Pedobacter sp.]|nr:MAG: SusD/RagB family nutrient-binding outer membrane lipoprotein [Pedobacter sp.]